MYPLFLIVNLDFVSEFLSKIELQVCLCVLSLSSSSIKVYFIIIFLIHKNVYTTSQCT